MNTPKRVLVTGANGFMGSHMVELLAKAGIGGQRGGQEAYEIVATDFAPEPSSVIADILHSYVSCDLRDSKQVRDLVLKQKPFDYVFHIAALFNYSAAYQDLYDVNVRGSSHLALALSTLSKTPQRVVMWGAAGVYDFTKESPAKETSPVNPKGGYLTTKYCAEMTMLQLGKVLGVPVTIIRPCGVYGPRSRYGVATSIMVAARGGMGPFYFGPGNTRAGMIHAVDVCRAAEFLAQQPSAAGEIFNVNDDSNYTTAELMRTCGKYIGFPMLPINFPIGVLNHFVRKLGRVAASKGRVSIMNTEMTDLLSLDAMLDASKLKALGWKAQYPDSLKGLLNTIDWYVKEGWL